MAHDHGDGAPCPGGLDPDGRTVGISDSTTCKARRSRLGSRPTPASRHRICSSSSAPGPARSRRRSQTRGARVLADRGRSRARRGTDATLRDAPTPSPFSNATPSCSHCPQLRTACSPTRRSTERRRSCTGCSIAPAGGPGAADLVVQWQVARALARPARHVPIDLVGASWAPWWCFRRARRLPAKLFRPVPSVDAAVLTVTRRCPSLLPVEAAPQFMRFVRERFAASGSPRAPRTGCDTSTRDGSVSPRPDLGRQRSSRSKNARMRRRASVAAASS